MTARDIVMGAAGASGADKTYIEDVFSTYVFDGNNAIQTINNGISLGNTKLFADSSINNISAEASGSVTTASSSPFSAVTSSASIANDSSGIVFGDNSNLNLSGNFTIEGWFYKSTNNVAKLLLGSDFRTFTTNHQIQFEESNATGRTGMYHPSTGWLTVTCSSSPVNQWFHLAYVRNGSTVTIYLNGVSQGTISTSQTYNFSSGSLGAFRAPTLAQGWVGNISCFRITNTVVYSGNFTPSTTPLTAISGTVLLLQLNTLQEEPGKGGMVWLKQRNGATQQILLDTARGTSVWLKPNQTSGNQTYSGYGVTSFNTNGFTVTDSGGGYQCNTGQMASWTFRKAPKFFDVVTYTGDGEFGRSIPHGLGSVPGMVIVKRTDSTGNWVLRHKDASALLLNSTAAAGTSNSTNGYVSISGSTTTTFFVGVGSNVLDVNEAGATYVAYLFAHDTTTDGLIQCGSYSGTGSAGNFVNLGWEPQYILIKQSSASGSDWIVHDTMRGLATGGSDAILDPNTSGAEWSANVISVNATGFTLDATGAGWNASGSTYIYMAIRRGPMKTPTDATKVFKPNLVSAGDNKTVTTGFPVDLYIEASREGNGYNSLVLDRLRGNSINNTQHLRTANTNSENTYGGNGVKFDSNTNVVDSLAGYSSYLNAPWVSWSFKRAPGFFDVVCYTGTGAARTINHNLGVAPELIITKRRNLNSDWQVYAAPLGLDYGIWLQGTSGAVSGYSYAWWNDTSPTSTQISVGPYAGNNGSGDTYVAYLFASCPGVSKVGTLTYTGSALNIDCGFTNGARFLLLKRVDTADSWYVYDTARGITDGGDPWLTLNSTGAEHLGSDDIDPYPAGFTMTTNWGSGNQTYIYLAIA